MVKRWPRRAQLFALLIVTVALFLGILSNRGFILRAAGWLLVFENAVGEADVVILSIGADGAGALEAADLFHSGIARRVAVFTGLPDTVAQEFFRRGIPYEDEAARAARQLEALRVTAVERIPRAVAGTEEEGEVLSAWCDQHKFRSIVVVSLRDHSRRLHRILYRAMKGHQTKFTVRIARHSPFDPDHWWQTRSGIRTEIQELEKLLLDILRHPIY